MQLTPLGTPSFELAGVGELRKQVNLGDDSSQDDELLRFLKAATEELERMTLRSFARRKWRCEVRKPCRMIELPRPPLAEVTHVWFKDTLSGSWEADESGFEIDEVAQPAVVYISRQAAYVQIDYWAGCDSIAKVPEDVRDAVIQMVAFRYHNRGDMPSGGTFATGIPVALRGLIDSLKLGTVAGYF